AAPFHTKRRTARPLSYESTELFMIVDLSPPTVPRMDDPGAQVASGGSRPSATDATIVELRDALTKQMAINAQLERLNTIRSRFISIVTHEFRTALTGIQGFSEMI